MNNAPLTVANIINAHRRSALRCWLTWLYLTLISLGTLACVGFFIYGCAS